MSPMAMPEPFRGRAAYVTLSRLGSKPHAELAIEQFELGSKVYANGQR